MMNDQEFDKIIQEKEKDIINPLPDHLWSRVENKLDQKQESKRIILFGKPWFSIAAGVAIIAVCFFVFDAVQGSERDSFASSNPEFVLSLEDIPVNEDLANIPSVNFQRFLTSGIRNDIQEGNNTSLKPTEKIN